MNIIENPLAVPEQHVFALFRSAPLVFVVMSSQHADEHEAWASVKAAMTARMATTVGHSKFGARVHTSHRTLQ